MRPLWLAAPLVLAATFLPAAMAGEREGFVSAQRAAEIAALHLDRGEFADAVGTADAGIGEDPRHAPLWLVKARAHLALGEFVPAAEAARVCLAARPDDPHILDVSFRIVLDWPDLETKERRERLRYILTNVGETSFARLLETWMAGDGSFMADAEIFLPAWRESGVLAGPAMEAMSALHAGELEKAVAAGSAIETGMLPEGLDAALRCFLARLSVLNGHNAMGMAVLTNGTARQRAAEVAEIMAMAYRESGQAADAAIVLLPVWSMASDPAGAAMQVADDFIACGDSVNALAILDASGTSFGRLPSHRARVLTAQDQSRENDFPAAPQAEAENADAALAWWYGRALTARRAGDLDAETGALAELRRIAREDLGFSLDAWEAEEWINQAHHVNMARRRQEAEQRYAVGRRLWNDGMRSLAVALWSRALSGGLPNSRRHAVETVALLAGEGMGQEAATIARRHLSSLRPVDHAVRFADEGRWRVLEEFLTHQSGPPVGVEGLWLSLLRTRAVLETAEEPETLAQALQDLGNRNSFVEPLTVRGLGENGGIHVRTLETEAYRKIMEEIVAAVVHRGDYALYEILLTSPQWKGAEGTGIVDIAQRLLRAGRRDAARRFYEAIRRSDNPHPAAAFGLALLELREERLASAERHLEEGLPSASGVLRERMLALRAQLAENPEAKAEHLFTAMMMEEEDHDLRLEALRARTALHRYDEAAELAEYYEPYRINGDMEVLFHLAHARFDLGEFPEAATHWRTLHRRYPDSIPALAGLGRTLNQVNRPEETVEELTETAMARPTVELCALLAEAHLAMAQYCETIDWAERGLALDSENLRLLGSAVRASEGLAWHAGIETYAARYICLEPYNSTMQLMYGQALVDQQKWFEVYHHYRQLVANNDLNWAALERELERRNQQFDEKTLCSWIIDRYIVQHFDNNANHVIRTAVRAAGLGKYHRDYYHAFPALERLYEYGPNASALTLYYSSVSVGRRLGAVRLEVMRSHLDALGDDYFMAGLDAVPPRPSLQGCPEPVPLLLLLGRTAADDLLAADAMLAERCGRAVLIVGEESLSHRTPMWADLDVLRQLAATGRWEFVLSDYSPKRLRGPDDGEWTDFWTRKRRHQNGKESEDEMRQRLVTELRRLRDKAEAVGIPISGWVHPSWGDYGQRVIDGDREAMRAYLCAVEEVFPIAFTQTPGGFSVPDIDPFRIPMRTVGDAVDPDELRIALEYGHPTRRAALELAKVKSWNGQYAEADDLFRTARVYRANPKDITYFHARNSQFFGDVNCAVALSHDAYPEDPGNQRTRDLINDTHRMLRPLLTPGIRHWSDSNKEKYTESTATLSFHVNRKWELRILSGYHRWSHPERSGRHGASAGFGVRHYFKPGNWWLAEARGVAVAGGGSFPEARLQWHGWFHIPRWQTNGIFDLSYHREGIETRDAIAARIRANRLSAEINFRVRDVWDVDFNNHFINRTDGNTTWSTMLRPTYRFRELPQIRAGYWFAMADSDRNPPEYYAPVRYMAHQAVVMYRHNINDRWSLRGLASYGYARARGTGWRRVFRANAGITYRPNKCVSITTGYNHLKLPDYTLKSYTASIGIRF